MKDEALGYYDPRPWHRDRPQRPKVWDRHEGSMWGLAPAPDFSAAGTEKGTSCECGRPLSHTS